MRGNGEVIMICRRYMPKLSVGLLLFILVGGTAISPAYAASVSFQFASYTLTDGGVGEIDVKITVTDATANTDSGSFDTVTVTVTSDSDSTGTTLTLNETGVDTGIFENENLLFTDSRETLEVGDKPTVRIESSSDNIDPNTVETVTVSVKSSSDTTGIFMTLTETGKDTGVFEKVLELSTSSGTNKIEVKGGDVLSIGFSGEKTNALIVPKPNPLIGVITAADGDTITATYQPGVTDTATIDQPSPGGGGGGIVRPGLILDVVVSLLGGGSGCRSDCTPPTLGLTQSGKRVVDVGFSYNGNATDVQLYYTPYPLITVEVGEPNIAELKIYEDSGIDFIRHVDLAFGIGEDEVISQSKAVISYDISFDGTATTDVFDPENALENVTVTSSPVACNANVTKSNCLLVSFNHTFRAPLEFNMVGTNVWDEKRNSWQNYYNHGIEIVGESLNPPKTIQVLDRQGYRQTVTLIDKNHGIDSEGNKWNRYGNGWLVEYKPPTRPEDPITMHGIDRNHSQFLEYLKEQERLAYEILYQKVLNGKHVENPDFEKNIYRTISGGEHLQRWEKPRAAKEACLGESSSREIL